MIRANIVRISCWIKVQYESWIYFKCFWYLKWQTSSLVIRSRIFLTAGGMSPELSQIYLFVNFCVLSWSFDIDQGSIFWRIILSVYQSAAVASILHNGSLSKNLFDSRFSGQLKRSEWGCIATGKIFSGNRYLKQAYFSSEQGWKVKTLSDWRQPAGMTSLLSVLG